MKISDLFKYKHKCSHPSVPISEDTAYCPDCGELIENRWYIMRCKCCGVKIKAILKNGKVVAGENYCHNCGNKSFEPERVSKINFIDINYAVLQKTIVTPEINEVTQSWQNSDELTGESQNLIGRTSGYKR